jgi:hypothetical protein
MGTTAVVLSALPARESRGSVLVHGGDRGDRLHDPQRRSSHDDDWEDTMAPQKPGRVLVKKETVIEEDVLDEEGDLVEGVRVDTFSMSDEVPGKTQKQRKSSDACLPFNVPVSEDRIRTAATCWCLYWIWRDGAKLLHVAEQVSQAVVNGEVDLGEPAACEAYDYLRGTSRSHVIDRWRTVERIAGQLATPLTRPTGGALPRFARSAARGAGSSGVGDRPNRTGGSVNLDEVANFDLAGYRLAQQTSLAVYGIDECITRGVAKHAKRASKLLNNPKVMRAFGEKDLPALIDRYSEGELVDLLSYSDLADSGEQLLLYCAERYGGRGTGNKYDTSPAAGVAATAGPFPTQEVLLQGVRFRDAVRALWPTSPAAASLPAAPESRRLTPYGGVFGMQRDVLGSATSRSLVRAS